MVAGMGDCYIAVVKPGGWVLLGWMDWMGGGVKSAGVALSFVLGEVTGAWRRRSAVSIFFGGREGTVWGSPQWGDL
eukprot:1141863-Pelagomonas_calceolata.AAC.2